MPPVMRQYFRACSIRFLSTRPSRASAAMVPTTPKTVTKQLRTAQHRRLFLPAKTPSHGRISVLVPKPETPSWQPRAGLARKSGKSGAAIIGAALSRPRCIASNCSVNASQRVPSTVKSPSSRSVPLSSIGSPDWARLLLYRWPCRDSAWDLGNYELRRFMQQSPVEAREVPLASLCQHNRRRLNRGNSVPDERFW